ncbi:MAG TPA: alpha/beta fold hydrolase [Vicinamibacterales bacterium]|jgi:pimeloyl-ACP methyl ester carboxylesterase/membrane protease YdiL (CAAX protease family)|nr:alpha/beta fold hydrolase [Vicinamibacterales bacterium]
MKDWVKRHPLSSYFFVAYVVSWSIAVPLALQAQGFVFHRLPWSLHYLAAFGPAAAALLIARLLREPARTAERAEPRSVARGIFWWTVGVGSPLLLFVIALVAARIAGQTRPTWTSLGHINFLPDLGVMAWGLWFLTSGVGEELGWRGFALPRLQRTHSAMSSTLLLAIGWAGWHLPAFFYVPSYTALGLRILPGFFLGVLAGAIVLTWLYNSSGGSVLTAVLWHASFNFVTASPNAGGLVAAVTSTLVMVWAIVVIWRYDWATLASLPRSVRATREEKSRALPGDERIPEAIDTLTHGVTIRRPPRDVWSWLAQMGAGNRAGWYSYDWLDNGRQASATRIVPELQHPAVGTIFPALPGVTDGFVVLAIEPERVLMLGWLAPNGTLDVTWTFVLDEVAPGVTRVLVRARGGPGYRFHVLPLLLTRVVVRVVHFIMQRKQLLGIAERAEMAMSHTSVFKTPEGEAAFLAAYHAVMKLWPVPYEEMEVPSRFGMTHIIVSGPKDASPLVLLHGYMATSAMWAPNIADFSKDYRVYAIDVMGQPSKSIPTEPIRNAEDYAVWLAETLDGLHLDRICLVGQSYGGWLALNFALSAPDRLQKLVLLSPGGGFVPMVRQFSLRGMLMVWFPTRVTVNWFMRWLGITGTDARYVRELTYLGLKHFRVPVETLRVMPVLFPDDRLRAMRVPTLLLIGDHEVICDPATALARARRLFPDVRGELVPQSSHDMCFSQRRIVDARVLDFLKKTRTDARGAITERSVA